MSRFSTHNLSFDDSATLSKLARRLRSVSGSAGSRRKRAHKRRHVDLLGVGPGEEAVGAEQLSAERPDSVAVDHPPPQTRDPDRQSVAQRAEER